MREWLTTKWLTIPQVSVYMYHTARKFGVRIEFSGSACACMHVWQYHTILSNLHPSILLSSKFNDHQYFWLYMYVHVCALASYSLTLVHTCSVGQEHLGTTTMLLLTPIMGRKHKIVCSNIAFYQGRNIRLHSLVQSVSL